MNVRAPGKVLLFGAYAVLEGAPSLVVAVDRYAVADGARAMPGSREVRAAMGDAPAPFVDTASLYEGDAKLGLGSSAAVLVATLGLLAARDGADLASPATRADLFARARAAHAAAQGGGSGVDVAASTFGGALAYTMADGPREVALAPSLAFTVFWSGTSARTSELVARVASLKTRDASAHRAAIDALGEAATGGIAHATSVSRLVTAGQATARALAELGRAADAPIVPPAFAELAIAAGEEHAAFYPSGAGGGDVGVWLGSDAPSPRFLARATARGMRALTLGLDASGVCLGRKD